MTLVMGRKSRDIVVLRERIRELRAVNQEKTVQIRDLEQRDHYQRAMIAGLTKSNSDLLTQISEVTRNPEQIVQSILGGIAPLFIGYSQPDEEAKQNKINELVTSLGGDPEEKGWVPEFEMDGDTWEHISSQVPTTMGSDNGKKRSEVGPTAPPPGFVAE